MLGNCAEAPGDKPCEPVEYHARNVGIYRLGNENAPEYRSRWVISPYPIEKQIMEQRLYDDDAQVEPQKVQYMPP